MMTLISELPRAGHTATSLLNRIQQSWLFSCAADAKLVSGGGWFVTREIDFQELLTLHRHVLFISQAGNNPVSGHIDHISRRRIPVMAIDAETDPSGLIAQGDAGHLAGRPGWISFSIDGH